MPTLPHLLAAASVPNTEGWLQAGELGMGLLLSAVIGLEREIRQKSAGLRTHTMVGVGAALFMLVSKYGFTDVLSPGLVLLDPSRVAAQVVSGIGFLGAGIIITRRGAIHGLTTAAAVWESAAIGLASGAGLLLLAAAVVALHFVSALAFSAVERQLKSRLSGTVRLQIIYDNGRGVLREILQTCGRRKWLLTELEADDGNIDRDQVAVSMTLSGNGIGNAVQVLDEIDGVTAVLIADDEPD